MRSAKKTVVLKNGRKVRVIVRDKAKHSRFGAILGSYDYKHHTIEILPARTMWNLVLKHEMHHAESRLSRIISFLISWQTIAMIEMGVGAAFMWIVTTGLFHLAESTVSLAFSSGMLTGFSFMVGVIMLGAIEELRNRLQDGSED